MGGRPVLQKRNNSLDSLLAPSRVAQYVTAILYRLRIGALWLMSIDLEQGTKSLSCSICVGLTATTPL